MVFCLISFNCVLFLHDFVLLGGGFNERPCTNVKKPGDWASVNRNTVFLANIRQYLQKPLKEPSFWYLEGQGFQISTLK